MIPGAFERHKPYLIAGGVYGGARGTPAEVSDENCAQGGTAGGHTGGGRAEGCKARRGREGAMVAEATAAMAAAVVAVVMKVWAALRAAIVAAAAGAVVGRRR